MLYNGISLDLPGGKPQLTHSVALNFITGQNGNQNVPWIEKMWDIPWGNVKEAYPERFEHASKISSLINMNYQICNGGIGQYFFNGYHEARDPFSEHDVAQLDIDVQKEFFEEMVKFAMDVFPDRLHEAASLDTARRAFQDLWYEENAEVTEEIYCDEDEYIFDEDLGEEVPNPDYFEPYDEITHENVIHGDNGFDGIYYDANDYLEELLEIQAQLCCKQLALQVEKNKNKCPELFSALKEVLPDSAFLKPSLSDKIKGASARTSDPQAEQKKIQHELS